jgi:hypothetical protein
MRFSFVIDVGDGSTFADQFNGWSTRSLDLFDLACAEEWPPQMGFFEPQLDTFDLQLVDVVERRDLFCGVGGD